MRETPTKNKIQPVEIFYQIIDKKTPNTQFQPKNYLQCGFKTLKKLCFHIENVLYLTKVTLFLSKKSLQTV
jgi:hypothetical protein